MLTVVTSFSPTGFEQYGRTFVETFREFWPEHVRLICAWEGPGPSNLDGFDLLQTEPCASFLARHKGNPAIAGKKEGTKSPWGPKAREKGYSFRHDAYKFARKVFAVSAAARYAEGGKLFWTDADVVTHAPVQENLLHKVLPDDVSLCYLAREGYHSELGFVGYNLDRVETHAFIKAYEDRYAADAFLADPFWDDCNQFDYLVPRLHLSTKHIAHTDRAAPFDHSMLGKVMTHLKGGRKVAA